MLFRHIATFFVPLRPSSCHFFPYCCPHTTYTQHRHPCPGWIRPHKHSKRAAAGLRLWTSGHWGRQQSACFMFWFLTRVLRRSVHKQPQILSGIWIFTIVFTTVHYWILSTAGWIQSKPSHLNSLKSLSIWCPIHVYAFRILSFLQIFRRLRIVAKNAC